MLKLTLVSVFFLICVSTPYVNGAAFENVKGNLTTVITDYLAYMGVGENKYPRPKRTFYIKSDDYLLPYVERGNYLPVVEIHNQFIPKLPRGSISNLTHISRLEINKSGLEEIEPGAFGENTKLTHIDFEDNKIKVIKNGVFSGLGITYISLSRNQITTIEDKAFTHMKLKSIFLDSNQISTWSSEWFTGSPVYLLHLGWNAIQELPSNAFAFKTVPISDLNFRDNQIKNIQPGAFNGVGDVTTINLGQNQIEELVPDAFTGITDTYFLHLEHNKISKINAQLFENKSIYQVNLEDNQLAELPWDLLNGTTVQHVLFKNNPLKCSFAEEAENWVANKTGDFFGDASDYKNLKKNCI